MVLTIQWTVLAEEQLKDIFAYKTQETNNSSAKRLVNKLVSHLDILQFNPYVGKKEKLLQDYPCQIRSISYNQYNIFFRKEEDVVTILAVLDQWQYPKKSK